MERNHAMTLLRKRLDEHGLRNWHVRLVADLNKPFLGMCSFKDKAIILNAHHIDTHPDIEVIETINHEVAHALTPGHAHDEIWQDKARELGCSNLTACAHYGFNEQAIDAIRSGADVVVTFEEHTIRTPKYTIHKLQDKCPICGKVAKEIRRQESDTQILVYLECGHLVIKKQESLSPFSSITFDGDKNCQHQWDKTVCWKCGAKKLYQYQIEGARAIERANGRFAIFDEMGLGKTIQALAYLSFERSERHPFLWVTKSSALFQHAKEIYRVLGPESFPQILRTGQDRIIPGMNVMVSYDLFRRLNLKQFEDAGIKTVILDEVQAIKNPDSSRTQCVRKVCKHIPKIIPLSGTPWKNRGSEFFVVLNLLDPVKFHSFKRFKDEHVDVYWQGNRLKEGGIRKPAEFRKAIEHIAIRRERIEVMPELPLVNRTRIMCELPDFARNAYEQEEEKLVGIYNNAVIGGEENTFDTQSQINAQIMVMRQIVGIAKVPNTVEYAKEFLEETDRKLVIFVNHIQVGDMIESQIAEYCKENDYPAPLRLRGGLAPDVRFAFQEAFNDGPSRIMVASTLASGEALNLQKSCSDCVMHERQWNPANEEQAEGRFIRIGQTSAHINAVYMHASDTCDEDLHGIVEPKRLNFHRVMNKGEMPIWDESSIQKEVIKKIVEKYNKKRRKAS